MHMDSDEPNYETIKNITSGIDRIVELTHKIMRISKYKVKGYIDINESQ
ncbi:MAG: hypothetical protein ABIK92_17710 [Pseudomonadota bacterium]